MPGDASHPPLTKFRISPETIATLNKKKGIYRLFPIQAKTFDLIYDGKDVIGRARTGTGKTFSFALPVVERILLLNKEKGSKLAYGRGPRVLVIAPTRELALQVCCLQLLLFRRS